MRVNITCKGFTANDRQIALIEKKFEKLAKYFSDDIVVNVTMGYKKRRQTMEAMITLKGVMFRAEHTDSDMNVCVDKVVDLSLIHISMTASAIEISRTSVPRSFMMVNALLYVLSVVPKPGIVTAMIFFVSRPSILKVSTQTSSASVESRPPEIPTTAVLAWACSILFARPAVWILKISSQRSSIVA